MHETIWGGRGLQKYVGEQAVKLGHLYMVNGHMGMSNKILNGSHKGRTLHDVFELQKHDWNMSGFEEFPLTIALVNASEYLSIQVHPDDSLAERLENKRIGKTESWFFLEAPVDGWIYDGCRCNSKKEVMVAVSQGRMEEITDRKIIRSNDYVCIEAGTLHAMTRGSMVYEIEYGSDFTYRFYDYGRKDEKGKERQLHVDKAIQAIRLENIPRVRRNMGNDWITEQNYEIRRITGIKQYRNDGNELECLSLICGSGSCQGYEINTGISIIHLPGERIENIDLREVMVARLTR